MHPLPLVRLLSDGPIDVIGDVHGESDALLTLVRQLGYDDDGTHKRARRLVFIGDLTDRGPDSPGVAEWVMRWVERSAAECLLGNHELNLLNGDAKHGNSWLINPSAADLQDGGEFAHSKTADAAFKARYLRFLRTLPLVLERKDLRLVHAAWDSNAVQQVRRINVPVERAFTDFDAKIDAALAEEGLMERAISEARQFDLHDRSARPLMLPALAQCEARRQSDNPIRVLTSGLERPAPAPQWLGGRWRMCERARWWNEYADRVPVIVGHYWRRWAPIWPEDRTPSKHDVFFGLDRTAWAGPHANVFCIDYSVGGRYFERKAGAQTFATRLMAMRWPERELWGEEGRVGGSPP